MEHFRQTVMDLFEIHFPEDLYTELIKFIPSKYVNRISNSVAWSGITIPTKYVEGDWDALFRWDFIQQNYTDMLYYIPNQISISHGYELYDGADLYGLMSFAINKFNGNGNGHRTVHDLVIDCVVTGHLVLYNTDPNLASYWYFIIK